ncbi:related to phosphoethanolamine N-methyltransferase [Ustilago trichophora]|uniref:Related to phosphoethanolamine N-methyltransferase n=1 Tax=Ustilago trichophora TaxID=86804 RepID=A0A5C3EII4_9BASI|nr:related to phosphoethanolamine N-methyltransferase [Ustilago trichophora]
MTTPNYSTGNDRFDTEAATWDTKPEVVLSSKLCLESILAHTSSHFPALSSSSVLEIGCGTGLLTIRLAQHVRNILALDTAQGMISMLNAKIDANGLTEKVRAKVKLLEDPKDDVLESKEWDAVVSHLVFHHVPDMLELVKVMFGTLKQGGRIWISDFEDNGVQAEAFHPKDKHAGVERHGLKRRDMEDILTKAGFKKVEVLTSFTMDKEVESGGVQAFPFLAITGIKP